MSSATDETVWQRAAVDFKRRSESWLFKTVIGLVDAAAGAAAALLPEDVSGGERILAGVVTAAIGLVVLPVLVFSWGLIRAPFLQRREFRASLKQAESRPTPNLVAEPAIEHEPITIPGQPERNIERAFIRVYNQVSKGGEAAAATHVMPELIIRDRDGNQAFHYKGWDTLAWRDFTSTGEEHGLWVAHKWRDSDSLYAMPPPGKPEEPPDDGSEHNRLRGEPFEVELTLKAYIPPEPVTRKFSLRIDNGSLSLTALN